MHGPASLWVQRRPLARHGHVVPDVAHILRAPDRDRQVWQVGGLRLAQRHACFRAGCTVAAQGEASGPARLELGMSLPCILLLHSQASRHAPQSAPGPPPRCRGQFPGPRRRPAGTGWSAHPCGSSEGQAVGVRRLVPGGRLAVWPSWHHLAQPGSWQQPSIGPSPAHMSACACRRGGTLPPSLRSASISAWVSLRGPPVSSDWAVFWMPARLGLHDRRTSRAGRRGRRRGVARRRLNGAAWRRSPLSPPLTAGSSSRP